jgi:CHAD domain-containing protein
MEDRLERSLRRRKRALRTALKRAPRGKVEMHELRIEAKKTRYLLDTLAGPGRGSFLKGLQDRLGRAHDLEVLQARLGPVLRAELDEARERSAAGRIMSGVVARALRELEKIG